MLLIAGKQILVTWSVVTRDGHGLILEENQTELNQTVFKIYNN
jgi:hypothetical protein